MQILQSRKTRYPSHELVCKCRAFPWPHAHILSQRCKRQNTPRDFEAKRCELFESLRKINRPAHEQRKQVMTNHGNGPQWEMP